MASENFTLVTLSGPVDMVDIAIQTFVINRKFHPENAISRMSDVETLVPFDSENPYSRLLDTAKDLAKDLAIDPAYRDFDILSMSHNKARDYLDDLSGHLSPLRETESELNLMVADNQNIISTLEHIQNVDESLEYMLTMKSVKFRFGRIPRNIYYEAYQRIADREDSFFVHTSIEDDYVYGMYFATPSAEEPVDSFFASLKFERIWISEKAHGTSEQAIGRLEQEIRDLKTKIDEIEEKVEELRRDEREDLLACYSYVRFMNDSFTLRCFAGHTYDTFYIVGWVPTREASELVSDFTGVEGFYCTTASSGETHDLEPPVKKTHKKIPDVFTPFVEMYSLPSYSEIDPTLFMTITYTVLFGIMFGDVGQGVVVFIAGLIMHKVWDMWLGKIVSLAGISATAFGFVYGSVFGIEDILPGFKVMEGSNVMTMLLISAGLGAVLICICMIMNIINGIRQRNVAKAVFSANGIAGLVFYESVIVAGVLLVMYDINLFNPLYIVCLIVLPLLLIMCHEPLSKLIAGKEDWKPESIGNFIVEGFFELFETILSYISNTISFLRVGAFAIIHAGMMEVVFLLSQTASGGYNPFILVFGNIFVMGLETLLVCIQLLRLEFYEMFGRFYDGGGVKFSPRIIDYSKFD